MTMPSDLPTIIQSIGNPRWTDRLRWTAAPKARYAMAEVDHDWRIWVHLMDGTCIVRHKGSLYDMPYDTLAEGLASLDYREKK